MLTGKTKRTVLLVDGSPSMLYYNGILMKRLQYAVLTAENPEDALHIMERGIPSLILTAISFPHMSGVAFIKKIKSEVRTRDVPVIVLTAEEGDETRSACLGLGCTAYLTKPVDPYLLFSTVQAASEPTQRQNVRVKTSLKTIAGDGAASGVEYATSISEGGLFLRKLSPLSKDEIIPVKIIIEDREINAKALVLYSCTLGRGVFREPGMGMKFVEISPEDRDFLRSFILAQLTNDIEHSVKDGQTPDAAPGFPRKARARKKVSTKRRDDK